MTLEVFNILGQKIQTIVDDALPAGHFRATFNAQALQDRDVSSGLFFYRFRVEHAEGHCESIRKMTYLR